jgi:predicted Rossmann-fold nucleotide-binding protein
MTEIFLSTLAALEDHLAQYHSLANCTIQNLDLRELDIDWEQVNLHHCTILGCHLPEGLENELEKRGALVLPAEPDLPYHPFRTELYTWQELMEGFDPENDQSLDKKIYEHFFAERFHPDIREALSQRIHDHSIDQAIRKLIRTDENGLSEKRCVGFMGGHGTLRSDRDYHNAALTARLLAQEGYYIVSGGGPGIMEAANLGAYFAAYEENDLRATLQRLSEAPHYESSGYQELAREILKEYPDGKGNLAIPTWFYGHEPSNLFATHIAKYFSNSLREDNLLAICLYGVVFAPGSAGTTQEIFQDAAQNHYGTFGYYSPMVFLSRKRYEIETLIFPLLKQLAWEREYYDLLFLADEPEEVVAFIKAHPPVRKE